MGDRPTTGATRFDHVVRAITDDDTFRVMVAVTTDTVRGAIAAQRATGRTAQNFAELVTGAVLIRETMAPQYRVQAILKGAGGRGNLIADAHPDGLTRGLVQLQGVEEILIGPGSSLQMMRSSADKLHKSVIQPPESGTVADALMLYLQTSEEIISVIAAGTSATNGAIEHAGGYVVQLLPGAARGTLMIMTERLAAMPPIGELLASTNADPHALLAELLYQMPYAELDDSRVRHGCLCSERAVLASIASLPRADIVELMKGEEVLEITCDYCTSAFKVPSVQLQGLLSPS